MQKFQINADIAALASISAAATRLIYALNPSETADDLPANYSGKVSVKSLDRVFTKPTATSEYMQGAALCTVKFDGENSTRKVWVPLPVLCAVVMKNAAVLVKDGKPYLDKQNKTVTRAQLYAPGTEVNAGDVQAFSSALIALAASQTTAPPPNNKSTNNRTKKEKEKAETTETAPPPPAGAE